MKKLKFLVLGSILCLSPLLFTNCSSDDNNSDTEQATTGNNAYKFTVTTSGNTEELSLIVTLGVDNLFEITDQGMTKAEVLYSFQDRTPGTYTFETKNSSQFNLNYSAGYFSTENQSSYKIEIFKNNISVKTIEETFTKEDEDLEVIRIDF